jgi:hypothetical protein
MAIVKDYMDGNCHVVIHDDCFVSKEEIPKLLHNMAEIYTRSLYTNGERKAAGNKDQAKEPA